MPGYDSLRIVALRSWRCNIFIFVVSSVLHALMWVRYELLMPTFNAFAMHELPPFKLN